MAELETVLAVPYYYERKGVCYLRLRVLGSKSDCLTISLRTSNAVLATSIARDILKRLSEFHFRNRGVSWQQLRAQAVSISRRRLSLIQGDASTSAYGFVHGNAYLKNKALPRGPRKDFYITPCGIAESGCAIQMPDFGRPEKGFGNPRGVWRVNLTVPADDARPLVEEIFQAHEANFRSLLADNLKNPPVVPVGKKPLLPFAGDMPFVVNVDGSVTFKIRRYASYIDRHTQEIISLPLEVVDSKGRHITKVPSINSGAMLKVRFSIFPYGWTVVAGASVLLHLDSVMLIKLAEFDAGGLDDVWANEVVDGGYETEERAL